MHVRKLRSPWVALLALAVTCAAACGGTQSGGAPQAASTGPGTAVAPSGSAAPQAHAPEHGEHGEHAAATSTPPLRASAFAGELREAGLRPEALPKLDALTPEQLRKVMGLMSRSLGVDCKFCHAAGNFKKETPHKKIAERMWNDWVVGHTVQVDGVAQPLFCDSCHQGTAEYLGRGDRQALVGYMKQELVARVQHDGAALECKSCHGEPFQHRFVETWGH